jgi:hypothetical protein
MHCELPSSKPAPSLYEDWLNYNRDVTSPESFIEMSFYFMIASALARRVYFQGTERPIYSNQYVNFVAGPGVGKGLILRPVNTLLRYHKLNPHKTGMDSYSAVSPQDKNDALKHLNDEEIKVLQEAAEQASAVNSEYEKSKTQEEPLLFPIVPDSTTFEDLTRIMARATRRITVPKEKYCALVPPNGIYTHNSLVICLEELSSLFKKKSEKIIDFLTRCYDGELYTNSTKTQGVDVIKKPCLNMIVGTQPNFLMDSYNEKLLTEGYSSRVWFVYEDKKRFERFFIPEPDEEQLAGKHRILAHLLKLSRLFGEVKMADDAYAYMKHYFEEVQPKERVNNNAKLIPYYERKKVHAVKLAIAVHYSRSLDDLITLEDCKTSLDIFQRLEPRMHLALQSGGKSLQNAAQRKIVKYLEGIFPEGKNVYELWLDPCEAELTEMQLTEMLKYLVANGLIEYRGGNPAKYRRTPRSVEESEKYK